MLQAEFDSSQAPATVAAGSTVREPGRPESGSGGGARLPLAARKLSQKLATIAVRSVGSGNAFKIRKTSKDPSATRVDRSRHLRRPDRG